MRAYTLFFGLSTLSSFAYGLWPQPREITTGTTALRLAPGFSVSLSGISGAPRDLTEAVKRAQGYLKNDKLQALVPDRGASSKGVVSKAKSLRTLRLKYTGQGRPKSISEEAIAPIDTRDEAYTLTVPADGSEAVLTANSSLGLFRGLTTFGQIWYDLDGTTYTLQAPISIKDAPAYVRYLLIPTFDCPLMFRPQLSEIPRFHAGHCEKLVSLLVWCLAPHLILHPSFPVADIKRHLDAMSWTKVREPLVLPRLSVMESHTAEYPSLAYCRLTIFSTGDPRLQNP